MTTQKIYAKEFTCNSTKFRYELILHEVDANPSECFTRPLQNDIILYAIYYEHCTSVYYNDDCALGCFYIPFVKCNSAATLQTFIKKLLWQIKTVDDIRHKNDIAIHVYKTIDSNKQKYAAIYAINRTIKSESLKALNVRTSYLKTQEVYQVESWFSCLDELDCDFDKTIISQIEIEEILDFESRKFLIPHIYDIYKFKKSDENYYANTSQEFGNPNALLLSNAEDDFYATHMYQKSALFSWSFTKQKMRSIFRSRIYKMTSFDEIYANVEKMIETFRTLTGITRCKTHVKYSEISHNIFDVSMATYGIDINSTNSDEEENTDF